MGASNKPMIYPAGLDTKFTFGKHKGLSIETVADNDNSYITWCIDNVPNFELTDEAYDYYCEMDNSDGFYGTEADIY